MEYPYETSGLDSPGGGKSNIMGLGEVEPRYWIPRGGAYRGACARGWAFTEKRDGNPI